MIKSIKAGYVTFEWYDGETYCLTVEDYNKFDEKHGLELVCSL